MPIKAVFFNTFPLNIRAMAVQIDDIGSFPLPKDVNIDDYNKAYALATEAAIQKKDLMQDEFIRKNFCEIVLGSFRKKLASGLDVATYPQRNDAINQIGDAIRRAMDTGSFVVDEEKAVLPEVYLISQEAKNLSEEFGKKIKLRITIFGPIEHYLKLIGMTPYPDVLDSIAETVRRFAKNSVLNSKYFDTSVVSIDEPSLGLTNIATDMKLICDVLEKAFDFQGGVKQIHLHSASMFKDLLCVKNLDVLGFEYSASPKNLEAVTRKMLDDSNKQVRVGISRTDIDSIMAELYEKGVTKPTTEQLVENEDAIRKRYLTAKEKYGERLTFTGPDCGLGSWPSQEAAELLLKRTVHAVRTA